MTTPYQEQKVRDKFGPKPEKVVFYPDVKASPSHPYPTRPKPEFMSEDWADWCLEVNTLTQKMCAHQLWLAGTRFAYAVRRCDKKMTERERKHIDYIMSRYDALDNHA